MLVRYFSVSFQIFHQLMHLLAEYFEVVLRAGHDDFVSSRADIEFAEFSFQDFQLIVVEAKKFYRVNSF